MEELFYTNEKVQNNLEFQKFMRENPGYGYVKIRASAANEAVPISNIKIKVTKKIGNMIVIFYDGETDYSGMINDIKLPAPSKSNNDEVAPKYAIYDMSAIDKSQNVNETYSLLVYDGITVIQYINVTPEAGVRYGC